MFNVTEILFATINKFCFLFKRCSYTYKLPLIYHKNFDSYYYLIHANILALRLIAKKQNEIKYRPFRLCKHSCYLKESI